MNLLMDTSKQGEKKCSSSMLPNDISMGEQGRAAEGEFLLLACVVLPIKMPNVHFTDSFAGERPPKQPRIIAQPLCLPPGLVAAPRFISCIPLN